MNIIKNINLSILFLLCLTLGLTIIYIGYVLTKSFTGLFFSISVTVIGSFICAQAFNIIPCINKKKSIKTVDVLIVLGLINILYFPHCLDIAGYRTLSIISTVLNAIAVAVIVISCLFIYKSRFYKLKIILRFLFFTSVIVVCAIVTFISVGVFINQWIKYDFSTAHSNWGLNIPGKFGEFMFMFVLPIFFESIYLLGYNSNDNIIVLRSFKYDEDLQYKNTIKKLKKVCDAIKLNVMYIGNPNSLFNHITDCRSYFLPTTNWQKEVSNLISNAKLIFCYLGVSEGIVWELFTHGKEWDKFIFYLDNQELGNKLFIMLENIEASEYKSLFEMSINHIIPLIKDGEGIAFMIKNNKCYYHNTLTELIKSVVEVKEVNKYYEDSVNILSLSMSDY